MIGTTARLGGAAAALAGALAISGCDRGDAGTPSRDHSSTAGLGAAHAPAHPPAPMLDGKAMWADNRDHSAEENAQYQFEHWGSTVGAHDLKDYARKARAFIDHPPRDVQRVSRPNGDVLIYDKGANLFAIVRRDGAPRLYRKPPGGEADWEKAKSEAPSGGSYRTRNRYRASNGSDSGRGEGE